MSLLTLPKSHDTGFAALNKQPIGPVEIDFSDPLASYLRSVFYFGLNNTGLTSNLDLLSGDIYQIGGTVPGNVTFESDVNGTHLNCVTTGAGSYGEIELDQTKFDGMTDITILSGYVRTADQDGGFGRIISRSNGGSGDDWSTTINADSGDGAVRWRVEGNSLRGATTLTNGQFYNIANTYTPGTRVIYLDGVVDASDTLNVGSLPSDQPVSLLANPSSSSRALTGRLYYNIVLDKALTQAEVRSFNSNIFRFLKPKDEPVFFPVSVAGVSGTAAITQAANTSSATGTTTVTGTAAATQTANTSTATGTSEIVGTAAVTQLANTSEATGSAGEVTGTAAITQSANTSTATGTTTIVGTATPTQAANTSTASGTSEIVGTAAITQLANTSTASGSVGSAVSGTAAITQAANTSTATGTSTIVGTVAVTQAANTSTASGEVGSSVTGTAAITQAANTSVATGVATIVGTAAITQLANTSVASGNIEIVGTSAITQAANTSIANGSAGLKTQIDMSLVTVNVIDSFPSVAVEGFNLTVTVG